MSKFVDRMIRAAKLDPDLYEEVEADKEAMMQSLAVIALSSLAMGLGMMAIKDISTLVTGTLTALLGWVIWAFITLVVGTKLLPEPQTKADMGEMLRTIGFAASPGIIRILGIIPGLTAIVFYVSAIWMLAAMVVAIRQALDYKSTGRAVGVCVIGWIVQFIIFLIVISTIQGLSL